MANKVDIATRIVDGILDDLRDRRGLRHQWALIEPAIQQEIRDAWIVIVRKWLMK